MRHNLGHSNVRTYVLNSNSLSNSRNVRFYSAKSTRRSKLFGRIELSYHVIFYILVKLTAPSIWPDL